MTPKCQVNRSLQVIQICKILRKWQAYIYRRDEEDERSDKLLNEALYILLQLTKESNDGQN